MTLLISGDFFFADSFKNQPLIENSIAELFAATDYRIINLEAPLTANESKNRILKTGPHLRTSAETVLPYLKQLLNLLRCEDHVDASKEVIKKHLKR